MKKQVLHTVQMAMFAALSIVLLYAVRMPLIPAAPFLEYDMADVPVLLGTLMLGTGSGLLILLVACLIQAITVSAASGWIGFMMHFIASGVLIITADLIYKKLGKNTKSLLIGLVCATAAMTVVMIPLNLIFTGIFTGAGVKAVVSMLIPAIIPFNLLKAGINCAITFIIFLPLKKILKKFSI